MRLAGRAAVITGAGRGIGKAISHVFAAEGANLILLDVDEELVRAAGREIEMAGHPALAVRCDVADSGQVAKALRDAERRFGKLDILVNNAGVAQDKLLVDTTDEEWDRVQGINLKGVFVCTREVARGMMKRRSGAIVNVSSVNAIRGCARQSAYVSSKAGVIGFTRSVAKELAPYGIRVNAIAPGECRTEMFERVPEQIKDWVVRGIPLGRLAEPSDIAGGALFLASDASRYMTGQVLSVDGGSTFSPTYYDVQDAQV